MRGTVIVAAATLAFAVPVTAQEHAGHGERAPSMCIMHGMQGAGGAMQHAAQGGMQPQSDRMAHGLDHYIVQPGRLLHHREELGLTADQVSRIEALQSSASAECEQHMNMARESHGAANQALNAATPDVQAFEARLRAAADHMVQGHTAAVRRGVEALNVLTPEQRAQLKGASHGRH